MTWIYSRIFFQPKRCNRRSTRDYVLFTNVSIPIINPRLWGRRDQWLDRYSVMCFCWGLILTALPISSQKPANLLLSVGGLGLAVCVTNRVLGLLEGATYVLVALQMVPSGVLMNFLNNLNFLNDSGDQLYVHGSVHTKKMIGYCATRLRF